MKRPSNWARKPRPIVAPKKPSSGKHDAQPIAETMTPSEANFSDIAVSLMDFLCTTPRIIVNFRGTA